MQQSKLHSDYQSALQELAAVQAELKSLQTEKSLVTEAQGDADKKYRDLVEKHSKLNEERQTLVTANKDLVQVKCIAIPSSFFCWWRHVRHDQLMKIDDRKLIDIIR